MHCNILDLKIKVNVSELCDWVGISRTAYYNIINDKSVPSLLVADLIVKYLNLQEYDYTIYDLWDM